MEQEEAQTEGVNDSPPNSSFELVGTNDSVSPQNSSFAEVDLDDIPPNDQYSNGEVVTRTAIDSNLENLFKFVKGEVVSFKKESGRGLMVVTNYRLYHETFEYYPINVPLGLIEDVALKKLERFGGYVEISCKDGRFLRCPFFSKDMEEWKEQVKSLISPLDKSNCFAFTHYLAIKALEQVSANGGSSNGSSKISTSNGNGSSFVKEVAASNYGTSLSKEVTASNGKDSNGSSKVTTSNGSKVDASNGDSGSLKVSSAVEDSNGLLKDAAAHVKVSNGSSKVLASHVEGANGSSKDLASHVEGANGSSKDLASHVEGANGSSKDLAYHVEGANGSSKDLASHVEGANGSSKDLASQVEGANGSSKDLASNDEGANSTKEVAALNVETAALEMADYFSGGSAFGAEIKRMNFDLKGTWRITKLNEEYQLCPSYPRYLITPSSISDDLLKEVAEYRRAQRIPAIVYRYKENGCVIGRCSQPRQGIMGYRSPEDEKLFDAILEACSKDPRNRNRLSQKIEKHKKLLIIDARSGYAAVGNRFVSGGYETECYYPNCEIMYMGIANIHHVRSSNNSVRNLGSTYNFDSWLCALEATTWMTNISSIIKSALVIVDAIQIEERPVVVHCSDGWDRTSQLTSLSQLLLDPYYRTIEGFQFLIEREWLEYGHKFADRCGNLDGTTDLRERSPIFLQWLDCVFQVQMQFPTQFEFNEQYLLRLVIHTYSNLFGTFLCNRDQDRRLKYKLHETTISVWPPLGQTPEFHNCFYDSDKEVLRPSHQIRDLTFWINAHMQREFSDRSARMFIKSIEVLPKRKTSSPKEGLDPSANNPLETSDIPAIDEIDSDSAKDYDHLKVQSETIDVPNVLEDSKKNPAEEIKDSRKQAVDEVFKTFAVPSKVTELKGEGDDDIESVPSVLASASEILASYVIPNLFNVAQGILGWVPGFGNLEEEPKPNEELEEDARLVECSIEGDMQVRTLEFDGLPIEENVLQVAAKRVIEKYKEKCCENCKKVDAFGFGA